MSGFVEFVLANSEGTVTISKTAVLFLEQNVNNDNVTHVHCVAGITHTVLGSFSETHTEMPNFILSQRKDNGQPKVAFHDWNVSYVEKTNDGNAIIYFTERGVSLYVNSSYVDIISKLP